MARVFEDAALGRGVTGVSDSPERGGASPTARSGDAGRLRLAGGGGRVMGWRGWTAAGEQREDRVGQPGAAGEQREDEGWAAGRG